MAAGDPIVRVTAVLDKYGSETVKKLFFRPTGAHNMRQAISRMARLLSGIANGSENARIEVALEEGVGSGTHASATLTIDSHTNWTNGDTITIGGRVLTVAAAPANQNEILRGSDANSDAANVATAINAHTELSSFLSASAAANVVTVTCLIPGAVGAHITVARSDATAATWSPSGALAVTGGTPTVEVAPRTYRKGY